MKKVTNHSMELFIADVNRYMRGDYDWCFKLYTKQGMEYAGDEYIHCRSIDFTIQIDEGEMIAKIVDAIDRQLETEREEFAARIDILNSRKQDFLALAPPAAEES